MTFKERKIPQSVGFTQEQLEIFDKLIKKDGGNISEHTRKAVDEYFCKKGVLK